MQLLEPIFGWMPLLDRDNIHIGALQTSMANYGQVDHFDWERFKLPPMKKDGQTSSWEIDASLSIIIQLRGKFKIILYIYCVCKYKQNDF